MDGSGVRGLVVALYGARKVTPDVTEMRKISQSCFEALDFVLER